MNKHKQLTWLCKCDCGNEKIVAGYQLVTGNTKSCGCLRVEKAIMTHTTHGLHDTRLFHIHNGMLQRCNNPNYDAFDNYGGRGITICEEWLGESGFINFYNWAMEKGYSEELSIDRIDVNGNYEPSNCRWATYLQQQDNRRNTKYVEIRGEIKTLTEWSRISGIERETLRTRLKSGWNPDNLLDPINRTNNKLDANKAKEIREMYSSGRYKQKELAELFYVSEHAIYDVVNHRTYRETSVIE